MATHNTVDSLTVINAANFASHHRADDYDYLFTDIDTRKLNGNVPLDAIRDVIKCVAKRVAILKIALGKTHDRALEMILSSFRSFGAPLLEKVVIYKKRHDNEPSGICQEVFRVLHRFPLLHELVLDSVHFSSPEHIERFFVSTEALNTLVLNDLKVVGDNSREVATAFQQGLQRNQTLQKISLVSTGQFDDPFLQGCLAGIRNNEPVGEVTLDLMGIHTRDAFAMVGGLASGTTAQKLNVTGGFRTLAEIIGGLATNPSVREISCVHRNEHHERTPDADLVQAVQGALQAWSESDKKLHVFTLRGLRGDLVGPFEPQHLHSLNVGLRQLPITELALNSCHIQPGGVPVLCDLIRSTPLKKLDLDSNPIGAEGVVNIIKAASQSALMEHLSMVRGFRRNLFERFGRMRDPLGNEEGATDISNCHESLRILLTSPRLVFLDLSYWQLSGPSAVESLADGLQDSPCLKTFKMPLLFQSLGPLENALEKNSVVETLEMFDSQLRSQDILRIHGTIQFYLELNRLGRRYYQNLLDSKPVPVGVLPHLFARMSGHSGHLFYFLCRTPPGFLAGQSWGIGKRKVHYID